MNVRSQPRESDLHQHQARYAYRQSRYQENSHDFVNRPAGADTPPEFALAHESSDMYHSEDMISQSFGQSAPDSPSSLGAASASPDQDDENDSRDGDFEDDGTGMQSSQNTCVEKRKMKRFRLTHNQTRFLMSEFARQAHPDAAHRERLSREVPGLSPRQVQVWFQNRRAKLKRLTTDDRERMMRSRALPEDFDMTQALHSPYGGSVNPGTPMTSPGGYSSGFSDDRTSRPVMLNPVRRTGEGESSPPSAVGPNFVNMAFPSPGSTANGLSPVSTTSDRSYIDHTARSLSMSDRSNIHPGGAAPQEGFRMLSHPSHMQSSERLSGYRSEPMSSPLRSAMTFPGSTVDYKDYPIGVGNASNHPPNYPQDVMPQGHMAEMSMPYYGPYTSKSSRIDHDSQRSHSEDGLLTSHPAAHAQAYHATQIARGGATNAVGFPVGPNNEPLHPPLVVDPDAFSGYHGPPQFAAAPSGMSSYHTMYMSPPGLGQGEDIGPDQRRLHHHPGFEASRRHAYTHSSEFMES
ncbi:MAG: hypothetical protein M1837_003637 [Sclerophora amabilis]|nr:MAG: hypothetical protein M1837_003637 [Sclerophora amabilis]